jgi:hypothetical protein
VNSNVAYLLDDKPVMLVVGNASSWRNLGRDLPHLSGFHFAGFGAVNVELLTRVQPDIVVSALMGEDFDAIDLARTLNDLGFVGRYRAMVRNLPNPGVVRREIRHVAPGLDFDILMLTPEMMD